MITLACIISDLFTDTSNGVKGILLAATMETTTVLITLAILEGLK